MWTNISRSKVNQTMAFGQLIEHNMINNFPEKPYTKCGSETISRTFSKKSKLSISLDQYSKFFIFCFYCLPSWRPSKVIETKLQITCCYKRSGACIPLPGQISMPGCFYFVRYWAIFVLSLFVNQDVTS